MRRLLLSITLLAAWLCAPSLAQPTDNGAPLSRIKDITSIEGVRDNHLFGQGLVVGLAGTGDGANTGFTPQALATMLRRMGSPIEADRLRTKSVALVMVTSKLPPYVRPGSNIDITVSTLGDATSLQGGTLLPTELRAFDGAVHAVAQGAISIGGTNPTGGGAGGLKLNHPTVGAVPNGAIVEGRGVETQVLRGNVIRFLLHAPDFATANRIKDAVNDALVGRGGVQPVALALNAGTVEVNVLPLLDRFDSVVELISLIEQLPVKTDEVARVVINERTGTVVMGHNVRISKTAISHHDFMIDFEATTFTDDFGRELTEETVTITEKQKEPFRVVNDSTTVHTLISALNALEVQPRDMIAILQALRSAGALKAELVTL